MIKNSSRMIFWGLFILTLMMAFLTGGRFLYYLVIFEGLFILISSIISFFTRHHIFFKFKVPKKSLTTGQSIDVIFNILNKSFFPIFNLSVDFSLNNNYNALDIPLDEKALTSLEQSKGKAKLNMPTSGIYNNSRVKLCYSDPLNIFPKEKIINNKISLFIYPKVFDLSSLNLMENYDTFALHNSIYEDFSDLKKVREYQPSDNIKRMHWKLSAKREELYVKEYEYTSEKEFIFIVDGTINNYPKEFLEIAAERVKELTVSIIKYCLKVNFTIRLIFQTEKYNELIAKETSDFTGVLKTMAMFKPISKMPFEEFITQEFLEKGMHNFITVVTLSLSENLVKQVLRKSNQDSNILLLYLSAGQNEEAKTKKLREILQQSEVNFYILKLNDKWEWLDDIFTN